MHIEKTLIQRSLTSREASIICPMGRINQKIPEYNPNIYCNWSYVDNVNCLVKIAKEICDKEEIEEMMMLGKQEIEHVLDVCKLFSDNATLLEHGKQLMKDIQSLELQLKRLLQHKNKMKTFLSSMREEIHRRRTLLSICGLCGKSKREPLYHFGDYEICLSCKKLVKDENIETSFIELKHQLTANGGVRATLLKILVENNPWKDPIYKLPNFDELQYLKNKGLVNMRNFGKPLITVTELGRKLYRLIELCNTNDQSGSIEIKPT